MWGGGKGRERGRWAQFGKLSGAIGSDSKKETEVEHASVWLGESVLVKKKQRGFVGGPLKKGEEDGNELKA